MQYESATQVVVEEFSGRPLDSNDRSSSANTGVRQRNRRRGNAEGSIYRRGDGRWVAAITDDLTKRQRFWYAKTRAEAARKLTDALKAKQDGQLLAAHKQTVGEFLARWVEEVARPSIRPATYLSYAGLIRGHLVPELGRVPLLKLSPMHVQTFMNRKLAGGSSARRVHSMRAVLRRALGDAMRWGLVGRNVATLVRPPAQTPREFTPLDAGEVRRLLDGVAGDRLEALYTLAVVLGLRQGELLGLRWEDIDFDSRVLRVRYALQRVDGKLQLVPPKTTRSRRAVQLPTIASEALAQHHARQQQERTDMGGKWHDTGFVFTTRCGHPLDNSVVTHTFQKHIARLGLPRQRFHDLRHACASLLLAEGVNPRVVMDILGHSQVSMTLNTYSHVVSPVQRDAVDRLDALLRSDDKSRSSDPRGPEPQLAQEAS